MAGVALFIVGVGLGLAFTVASDVILASVPKEWAGAAAAVSETAYELGMALGIATLGSIVIGVYRGFPFRLACRQGRRRPPTTRWRPRLKLPARCRPTKPTVCSPRPSAFTTGLAIASGVGSALLLAAAAAVWLLLKSPRPVPEAATSDRTHDDDCADSLP